MEHMMPFNQNVELDPVINNGQLITIFNDFKGNI
jgi:hypothetical protein